MSNTELPTTLYEYPFNERIRTLLRLEDLFERLTFLGRQPHHFCHHSALLTLFEILEVTTRVDLRSDLLQELERHRQHLGSLRNNVHVEQGALEAVLQDVDNSSAWLNNGTGRAGQYLRENEWLMNIRSRAAIPGGLSEFDLPSYHAWLMQATEVRTHDLTNWTRPLVGYAQGVGIVLKLLRETAQKSIQTATAGAFQLSIQGPNTKALSMLQVRIPRSETLVPEISANKYMLSVRLSEMATDQKVQPVSRDVKFELTLCGVG